MIRDFCDCCGTKRTTSHLTVQGQDNTVSYYDVCGACGDDVRMALTVTETVFA